MMKRIGPTALLLLAAPLATAAQTPASGPVASGPRADSIAAGRRGLAAGIPESLYAELRWRLVGPFRAGWATVAAGVPDAPNTFYFGAAGGGVWKSENAGRTWQPLMQHQRTSAVGALAVAASDARVLYVGTGQVTMRYDDAAGDGVYRSDDGGATWRNVGLRETRHIGAILVDPHNPDRVLVAALGHAFGSNPERGVYLTTDGGARWRRVLYVDDRTGAVDLAWDPEQTSVVYAALWQMRLHPWLDYFQPQAGPGSGIYKSVDGGEHWERLDGSGLPAAPLERIGLGVPRGSGGHIVYATVVAASGSGFYRSDDGGGTWRLMNDGPELASDYFGRVTVAPNDPDVVYVMARSLQLSLDGGRHFTIVKGSPGGDDYHFLWINPKAPDHMISAADQGAAVTVDGGAAWSSWYNQPTGQLYHVAVDDRFPYHIYSGQQDNGTVEIASRGPYGVIELRDWHPVGGDERDYMVPKPGNADVVFGSGLGGHVSRFDEITRQSAEISPWPVSSYGARPTGVKYRYTWITPLAFGPLAPHPIYLGSQVLFRSRDDGDSWEVISPDLSGKRAVVDSAECEDPDLSAARACGFGVVYTIAPSPLSKDEIWVGTDDGLIQLTTDGGAHWQNVTPDAVPPWGRIDAIAPSSFQAGVAYVAVDLHRLDRFEPLILKTTDQGHSWATITAGLPVDEYTTVVRADPERRGLLYAGSDRGVYVSFDDGASWHDLSLNFPTTWVRDLLVHEGDLIAATQGRGIWVLDDLEPLRQASEGVATRPAHLFRPAPAWRVRADENRDTPWPPSTPLGENPPAGAIIDYWLKNAAAGPVTLTITDSAGRVVRRFASDEPPESLKANRYFEAAWLAPERRLSAAAGMHRFVWDLRYPRPPALRYSYSIAAVHGASTPLEPEGPLALPGNYTVTLTLGGAEYSQPLAVKLDPRVQVSGAALRQQLELAEAVDTALSRAVSTYRAAAAALEAGMGQLPAALADSLTALTDEGDPSLSSTAGVLASLSTKIQSADAAPTDGHRAVYEEYQRRVEDLVARWERLRASLPGSGRH